MNEQEKKNILDIVSGIIKLGCDPEGTEKGIIKVIESLPTDNSVSIQAVKDYVDKFPMECYRRGNCEGCNRRWICDNLHCVDDWDIEEISKIINNKNP